MLLQIPDLLTQAQVARCRRLLETAAWQDGRNTAGHLARHAKHNEQLALDDPVALELGELILQALGQCPAFLSAALPRSVLPPRFNRHQGGGAYGKHIDNAIFSPPGAQRVRTDVSTTVFLSDPDEYEGGELIIEDSYGPRQVKLPAGHAVVYPGNSLHRVAPVTRGARYASFFWTQSLVRMDHRRCMLWELDTTIQAITAAGAQASHLSRLSGVYHNLLREWAET